MGLREIHYHIDPNPPGSSRSTTEGASFAGSLSLHLSVSLARSRRLAVPTARYVVRAAFQLRVCVHTSPALSFSFLL